MAKRYIFSLYGVNIERVNQKYGITPQANVSLNDDEIPANTTKIDDLDIVRKTPEIVSFLDESKRPRKCVVSMLNFRSGKEVVNCNGKTRYKCFWDRNPLPDNVRPIGCPIRYVASRAVKCYQSEISKEKYVISEPITERRRKEICETGNKGAKNKLIIEPKAYYETDGIFCSFNCCMAFIEDPENKHNPLYANSRTLLIGMYNELNADNGSTDPVLEIIPAPHWRMLDEHGGPLTIQKFRETFNKILYISHGSIACVSLGKLYEDNLKF